MEGARSVPSLDGVPHNETNSNDNMNASELDDKSHLPHAMMDDNRRHSTGAIQPPDSMLKMPPSIGADDAKGLAAQDALSIHSRGAGDVLLLDDDDDDEDTFHDSISNNLDQVLMNDGRPRRFADRLRGKVSNAAKRTQERGRIFHSNVVQAAKQTRGRVREKVAKTFRDRIRSSDGNHEHGAVTDSFDDDGDARNRPPDDAERHTSDFEDEFYVGLEANSDSLDGTKHSKADIASASSHSARTMDLDEHDDGPSYIDAYIRDNSESQHASFANIADEAGASFSSLGAVEFDHTESKVGAAINVKADETADAQQLPASAKQNKPAAAAAAAMARFKSTTKQNRTPKAPKSPRNKLTAKKMVAALRGSSKDGSKSLPWKIGHRRADSTDEHHLEADAEPTSQSASRQLLTIDTATPLLTNSNGDVTATSPTPDKPPLAGRKARSGRADRSPHRSHIIQALLARRESAGNSESLDDDDGQRLNRRQRKDPKKAAKAVATVAKTLKKRSKNVGKTIARSLRSKRTPSSGDDDDGAMESKNGATPNSMSSPKHVARNESGMSELSSPSSLSNHDRDLSGHSMNSSRSALLGTRSALSFGSLLNLIGGKDGDGKTVDWVTIMIIHCCLYSIDQIILHRHEILQNDFPWSAVIGLMLAAFTVGIRIDAKDVVAGFDHVVLGRPTSEIDPPTQTRESSHDAPPQGDMEGAPATTQPYTAEALQDADQTQQRSSPFKNSRRRRPKPWKTLSTRKARRSSATQVEHPSQHDVKQRRRSSIGAQQMRSESPSSDPPHEYGRMDSGSSTHPSIDGNAASSSSISIGTFDTEEAKANELGQQQEFEPFFELRGMDIFLSDDAEEEAGTHPFLIQNGLRNVPTFIVNAMSQWGNILVYFKMPDWVKDFDESLIETPADDSRTRALKRFLKGDNKYRRERLKIVPHIVSAPLPIRMMAPKASVLPIYRRGLVDTIYNQHDADAAKNSCCTVEVTVELMGNKAIRGMSSIVKRYIKNIAIDLALVIQPPNKNGRPSLGAKSKSTGDAGADENQEEPEVVLGLCCLKHVDLSLCEQKPERYEGFDPATVEQSEALLVQKYTSMANESPQ